MMYSNSPRSVPSPIVTGISPKEGPPGTRVIIRGENLGSQANDLIGLNICDSDCLLSAEWKSANKIIARSGPGKGRGDIIITTRLGGKGSSTVQFRGYHETIGPLKECAVWVEEAPLQTLSWGNLSLSHSNYHLEDPLGLSVEDNEKKFPEDDLHELFPDGSGDLASSHFEPSWFLLEHHHGTSFNDLKVGLSYLKRKVEHQNEGQLSFLKDNVSSVMEQMDTLFLLQEKFQEDAKIRGTNPTGKAEKSTKDSINEAQKLFQDVLARREKADATRNALAVMKRYKFLFFLPANIERNIKHGDYDIVISDYTRAKNLFGKSETPVFKNVLAEVETRIQNLKLLLYGKLEDMPSTLEQQKKIIRNLVILGFEGDPGWDAISHTYVYIKGQFNASKECYINNEKLLIENETGKQKSGSNFRSNRHMRSPSQTLEITNSTPPRVTFLEEIAELLLQLLSEFWKLGQSYFNGELQIKPDKSKQKEYKKMILDVVQISSDLLRAAVLPHTIDKINHWPHQNSSRIGFIMTALSVWLPHCVRYIRSMYSSLITLDLLPDTLDIIAKLLFDLRVHCLNMQLKQIAEQVKTFTNIETWKLEYGFQNGAVTELPNEFEKLVSGSLQQITESALQTDSRELPVLDNVSLRQELIGLVNKIFMNFVQSLEVLGMISEDHDHSLAASQLIGSPAPYSEYESSELVWEERLLATLSNCRYTRIVMFPKLSELFLHYGFPPIDESVSQSTEALCALEKRMVETYVELKCDPLVGTIEPSMYLGHFDWHINLKPTDMKPYAKEIITNITAVYAEVHRLVPKLIYPIICQIVETVGEELSRLMSCVTQFSRHGNQQARLDIMGLHRILSKFTTPNAESYFQDALHVIPPLEEDYLLIEDVLDKCFVKMKLQLLCFTEAVIDYE